MFDKVAYSFDLGEIAMINALLAGEGIEVPDLFRSPHVSIAGIEPGFYVRVHTSDAPRARAAIAASEFSHCLIDPDA